MCCWFTYSIFFCLFSFILLIAIYTGSSFYKLNRVATFTLKSFLSELLFLELLLTLIKLSLWNEPQSFLPLPKLMPCSSWTGREIFTLGEFDSSPWGFVFFKYGLLFKPITYSDDPFGCLNSAVIVFCNNMFCWFLPTLVSFTPIS